MSYTTQSHSHYNYNRGLTAFSRLLERAKTTDDLWNAVLGGLDSAEFVEKDGVYRTELNVAGYKREEISIEAYPDGYVTVTADSKSRGKSSRTFYLSDLDADKVSAKLEDGILTLEICRQPDALPRKVVVK